MNTDNKNPSAQIMLSLFVCSIAVPLLQNVYSKSNISFLLSVIASVVSVVFIFIMFIPTILIGKKTGVDFISFASRVTPNGIIFTASFYGLYLVYTAVYFLTNYTDMMSEKINPEANKYFIAFLILATCSYGAWKSANALTRCAVFLFSFFVISTIIIFSGNISNLNFSDLEYDWLISGSISDFFSYVSYFEVGAVISIIFCCLSGGKDNFKFRRVAVTLAGFLTFLIVSLFFIYFVLGDFGKNQNFQVATLSKASQLGSMRGFDSLYLIVSTSSIFLLISMLSVCMSKIVNCPGIFKISLGFCLAVFILYLCIESDYAVKEILFNTNIIMVLTIIGAIAIPCGYLLSLRRI